MKTAKKEVKRIVPIPINVPTVLLVYCGRGGLERRQVPVTDLTPREQMILRDFDGATDPLEGALSMH